MPISRSDLLTIKRNLVSARTHVQEAAVTALRSNDKALSERLREIASRIAAELEGLEGR